MNPPPSRRSRAVKPKRAGRLQPRDLEILAAIGRMRAATTPQLAALFFGDPSTASRRLAVLLGLGLVLVTVRSLNEPNLYTLSRHGLAALVRAGYDPETFFTTRLPASAGLEHLLAIGDLRVALLVEVEATEGLMAPTVLLDHELRRIAEKEGAAIIPDLLVQLEDGAGRTLALDFELDLGEESAVYFARAKGKTTLELARAKGRLWGFAPWRPLVVTPSPHRLRHLAVALTEVGAGALWWGTTSEAVNARGLLGPAWASAEEIARRPVKEQDAALTRSLLDPTGGVP